MITTETHTVTTARCDFPGCEISISSPAPTGFVEILRKQGWYIQPVGLSGNVQCYCPDHTKALQAAGKLGP